MKKEKIPKTVKQVERVLAKRTSKKKTPPKPKPGTLADLTARIQQLESRVNQLENNSSDYEPGHLAKKI